MNQPPANLITGATGYVGGQLVPRLLETGYRVRVQSCDPARLQGQSWRERVEVVRGVVPFHRRISFSLLRALARDAKARWRLGVAYGEEKNPIPSNLNVRRR